MSVKLKKLYSFSDTSIISKLEIVTALCCRYGYLYVEIMASAKFCSKLARESLAWWQE